MEATDLLIWGFVAHLLADWVLQNNWMATYKTSLRHPASWIHSAIHFAVLLFVFSPIVALGLSISHLLIDTRVPLQKWREFYGQTKDANNPVFIPFAMWQDQAAHIICLAVASIIAAGYSI
jgi:hypothetical protein